MCIYVCVPVCALGSEWVDPEDPTVIAETELLGAAASIEAAAKKLEQLKPRAKPKVGDLHGSEFTTAMLLNEPHYFTESYDS